MNGIVCEGDFVIISDVNNDYRIARVVKVQEMDGGTFVGFRTRPGDTQPMWWAHKSQITGRIGVWGE